MRSFIKAHRRNASSTGDASESLKPSHVVNTGPQRTDPPRQLSPGSTHPGSGLQAPPSLYQGSHSVPSSPKRLLRPFRDLLRKPAESSVVGPLPALAFPVEPPPRREAMVRVGSFENLGLHLASGETQSPAIRRPLSEPLEVGGGGLGHAPAPLGLMMGVSEGEDHGQGDESDSSSNSNFSFENSLGGRNTSIKYYKTAGSLSHVGNLRRDLHKQKHERYISNMAGDDDLEDELNLYDAEEYDETEELFNRKLFSSDDDDDLSGYEDGDASGFEAGTASDQSGAYGEQDSPDNSVSGLEEFVDGHMTTCDPLVMGEGVRSSSALSINEALTTAFEERQGASTPLREREADFTEALVHLDSPLVMGSSSPLQPNGALPATPSGGAEGSALSGRVGGSTLSGGVVGHTSLGAAFSPKSPLINGLTFGAGRLRGRRRAEVPSGTKQLQESLDELARLPSHQKNRAALHHLFESLVRLGGEASLVSPEGDRLCGHPAVAPPSAESPSKQGVSPPLLQEGGVISLGGPLLPGSVSPLGVMTPPQTARAELEALFPPFSKTPSPPGPSGSFPTRYVSAPGAPETGLGEMNATAPCAAASLRYVVSMGLPVQRATRHGSSPPRHRVKVGHVPESMDGDLHFLASRYSWHAPTPGPTPPPNRTSTGTFDDSLLDEINQLPEDFEFGVEPGQASSIGPGLAELTAHRIRMGSKTVTLYPSGAIASSGEENVSLEALTPTTSASRPVLLTSISESPMALQRTGAR